MEKVEEEYLADLALRNQINLSSSTISLLPGFVFRCSFDKNWTMSFISGSFEVITGYNIDDLIDNRKLAYKDIISPEHRFVVYEEISKKIAVNESYELEYKISTQSGEEKWLWERGKAKKDGDGRVVCLEGYTEDITSIKRTELEFRLENLKLKELELSLEISEKGYLDLLNGMKETVIVSDFDGNIINVNETAVKELEYSRDELVNSPILKINPIMSLPEIKAKLLHATDSHAQMVETARKTKNGKEFPVEVSLSVIDYLGKPAVLTIGRDISARKQAEKKRQDAEKLQSILYNKLLAAKEKAEESDKLKTAFLANMSHEIRTPMNGIIGFLELLNTQGLSEEVKNEYVELLSQSSQRLLDTLSDIIELSKIETSELLVQTELVDLPTLLRLIKEQYTEKAIKKDLLFKIGCLPNPDQSLVNIDKYKLERIIDKLLSNAIKFTQEGQIELGASITESDIIFYVTDSGQGIPKERQRAIFDRFVQVDINFNRENEGSGLGLAIAKAYVDSMKGSIWVDSEVGVGSTFHIKIPLAHINSVNAELKPDAIVNDNTIPEGLMTNFNKKRKIKVLIAEDDDISFRYLQRALKNEAFETIRVINGEDAIRIVRDYSGIDIVLMDIKMPLMDGLEATRMIRKFNATIPIIAQTAHTLTGDRENALDAGCSDYISKPISRTELINKIVHYSGSEIVSAEQL